MNKKELLLNIGGISQTSKMPCSSWSLSAFWCKNGSKLNLIKNSSCYGCYALTGNYISPSLPSPDGGVMIRSPHSYPHIGTLPRRRIARPVNFITALTTATIDSKAEG